MECWKVVNDIQMYVEQGAQTQDFKVLAEYYERKFDRLWDTFEQLVHTKQL
jgi:RNAse (barnase) inhibitor barstar